MKTSRRQQKGGGERNPFEGGSTFPIDAIVRTVGGEGGKFSKKRSRGKRPPRVGKIKVGEACSAEAQEKVKERVGSPSKRKRQKKKINGLPLGKA